MTVNTKLTDTERLLLAREAAADSYRAGGYVYDQAQIHKAFSDGWEAALEWVASRFDEDTRDLDTRRRIQDGIDGRG